MWWTSVLAILGLAAFIGGQKEAALLLLAWITWPLLRQMMNLRENSRREEREEDIVEGEIVYPEPLERVRGELPHSTRPALPDPDVVDVEYRELPPPRSRGWRKALAWGVYVIGLFLIVVGALVMITSVLSLFFR